MTMQIDAPGDVLGLTGEFPRPGWVVLDGIRERRYTGEVVFATSPEVRVYADLGRIYLAERVTEPSLGARLIDAGVLNAVQLERGALRIAGGEHLGRLFERVPSVDRHAVIVVTELMTEECVGWLAAQRITDIEVTPYRHHPSGIHRWDRPFGDLVPGEPLPAPPPDAAPVDLGAPEPLFTPIDAIDADPMITWNEPAFLDERPPQPRPTLVEVEAADEPSNAVTEQLPHVQPPAPAPAASDDWIDQLGAFGLPEQGSDPLATPIRFPAAHAEPIDRFEMIWPSGEVDEQFGIALSDDLPNPDHDRVGPTARMVRDAGSRPVPAPPPLVGVEEAFDPAATDPQLDDDLDVPPIPLTSVTDDDISDDVVMAVRRAVASIETNALAARRRLADANGSDLGSPDLLVPARLAVRLETGQVVPVGTARAQRGTNGSVFDDMPPAEPAMAAPIANPVAAGAPLAAGGPVPSSEAHRVGALRRLIGSLRRR